MMQTEDLANDTGTLLSEALKLNADLGRFVKNCSFSTKLTGRFYQNSSMEVYKAQASQISKMKSKRKQLEKFLEMEDKKIRLLEEKLREKERKHRQEQQRLEEINQATIRIQSMIRVFLSRKKADILFVERKIINYIVLFIQSLFRGKKERKRVHYLRQNIISHRKKQHASIQVQKIIRGWVQRLQYIRWKTRRKLLMYKAVCRIQSTIRGGICRDTLRQKARFQLAVRSATKIQSLHRGIMGRKKSKNRRRMLQKKKLCKPRIPLHERRYSIYSTMNSPQNSSSIRDFIEGQKHSEASLRSPHNDKKNTPPHDAIDQGLKDNEVNVLASKPGAEAISTAISTTKHDQDKVKLARHRAIARVAKLKRDRRREVEMRLQERKARDEELERLEMKRKDLIRIEANERNEKRRIKYKNKDTVPMSDDERAIQAKKLQKEKPEKVQIDTQHDKEGYVIQLPFQRNNINFDEDSKVSRTEDDNENSMIIASSPEKPFMIILDEASFEDEFSENEDDLEQI